MGKGRRRAAVRLAFPPRSWEFSRWQRDVWNATLDWRRVPLVLLCAGRGAGKDILAIRCGIRDLLALYEYRTSGQEERENPKIKNIVRKPLVHGLICAPSEHALKQTLEDFEGTLKALESEWGLEEGTLFKHHVREKKWSIFGRGLIEVKYQVTTRKDSLRGPGYDVVLYTEFATETREDAYLRELKGTVTRAGRLGRVYAYGSPKGPQGLLWREAAAVFEGGQEGERRLREFENGMHVHESGLRMFAHATSFLNDYLTQQQKESIRAEELVDPDGFAQERLARFVHLSIGHRAVYARELVERCLRPMSPVAKDERERGRRKISVGVDVARLGTDRTVFVGVDEGTAEIVLIESFAETVGTEIVEHMVRIAGMFGRQNVEFQLDATSHQAFLADFLPAGIRCELHHMQGRQSRSKEHLVLGLRTLMAMGRAWIPSPDASPGMPDGMREEVRSLISEVLQFQRFVSGDGSAGYSHPPGGHDDRVSAWMLAMAPVADDVRKPSAAEQERRLKKVL